MQVPEFLYPALLYLIIPVALLLLWLTRASFVRDDPRFDDATSVRQRSILRWTVFLLRTLSVAAIIVALATPLLQTTQAGSSDTHITLLIDNSSSMALMDTSFVPELIDELQQKVPVTVRTITPGESSAIGEGILSYLRPNENILLITDGNSNAGPQLAQVASFAAQTNSTINAVALEAKAFDAAVSIDSPIKAIAETNITFAVLLTRTEEESVRLTVSIDDVAVYTESTSDPFISFTRSFPAGKHRLSAVIESDDAIAQNNRYDFLLTVVDKPRVLVVTQKSSGLQPFLGQLYTVTTQSNVPRTVEELEEYYAVMLVDVPVSAVSSSTQALTQYLLNGNGLLVVGGPHSYDYGGYKNSVFESLLPVTVGRGKDRDGVTNIAIAMDLSGSVNGSYVLEDKKLVFKPSEKPALTRSLTLSVLDSLDINHNVGVVVVGSQSANASQNIRGRDELVYWDYVGGRTLGSVSLLGPKKEDLSTAIGSVQGGGQAPSQYWIGAPLKALEGSAGAKNIIIITDGQSCRQNCQAANGGSDEQATLNLAATVAAQGGKVYTVGLEPVRNEQFLIDLAEAGNGIYFSASQKNKLRILFGDPSQASGADAFGLVILNENHFITRGVNVQATLYGYNEVVPRSYSTLLASAGGGQPALTVWNYGVGRVAAVTAYNGDDYGELLIRQNSLLLSRTGNWVVGDPERKEAYTVTVPQLHVGSPSIISVHSEGVPVNDELQFTQTKADEYEASFTPQTTGFGSVGGIAYAASYPLEYENVGMNPALAGTLAISKGVLFASADVDSIVEHVQTVRQLQETRYKPVRYPFILAAVLLFFLEIVVRRFYEVLRSRRA